MFELKRINEAYDTAYNNLGTYKDSIIEILDSVLLDLSKYLHNYGYIEFYSGDIISESKSDRKESIGKKITTKDSTFYYETKFTLAIKDFKKHYNRKLRPPETIIFTLIINKRPNDYKFKLLNFEDFYIIDNSDDKKKEFYEAFCKRIIEFYENIPNFLMMDDSLPLPNKLKPFESNTISKNS
jgi:hypothetical protein